MENILKLILIGAGVLLTCIVVGVGFYISSESKNTSNGGMSQISDMNSEFQDVDTTLFDGLKVSGREVSSVITKDGDQLSTTYTITVKTLTNTTGKIYITKTTTFPVLGTEDYINPTAQFLGSVTYDTNEVVNGLVFTQLK